MSSMGYLGPAGTFTEEIALIYVQEIESLQLQEFKSIDGIIEQVAAGQLNQGIVPLENSLEGSVNITLDMLVQNEVYINKEIVYPISHCLMVPPGVSDLRDIQTLYSHSQAFSQCRDYVKNYLPAVEQVPLESTAAAAQRVASEDKRIAAIAPARAADLFGLRIMAADIQDGGGADKNGNMTRFVVVSSGDHHFTGKDKTSIIFAIKDGPGSLYGVLGIFAHRNINLTRIESRPSRQSLGEYLFFIDFEGHKEENNIKEALEELKEQTKYLKMLGSYPQVKYFTGIRS